MKQLNQLYENMKRNTTKKNADDRVERCRTGVGTYHPKITEKSVKILPMLNDHVEPDENPYDCDAEYLEEIQTTDNNSNVEEIEVPVLNEIEVPVINEIEILDHGNKALSAYLAGI